MKIKYLCLAICLAWSGVVVAETAQQASAVAVVAAKSDDELRAKEIELKAQEKSQAMMEKYLALHEKTITGQQKSIDWWIAAMGLILALAGYVQFKFMQSKQAEWEKERDELRDEMKQELDNVKNLKTSIQNHHDESQELIAKMRNMSHGSPDKILSDEQIAQNQAGIEAAEKLVDNREIPLIEQLRAQAILLSDNANKSQQYHDYEKAFHAWYAVWLQDENDANACFYLGFTAQKLYRQGTREQQLYWLPEIEKWYGKALQIRPDFYEVANNLGSALDEAAQSLQQENKLLEAYEKWQQAIQCYQQALQSKPDLYETVYNWGLALSHEAQVLQQEKKLSDAYEKWQQAGQLYERALQIKPDFHNAENDWGNALYNEAEVLLQEDKLLEAYEKWQQAGQHYKQALQIKPDFYDAAKNWGLTLFREAQVLRQENKLPEAHKKWQQARQYYEQVLQIKPDSHEAAYVLGLVLYFEAETLQQENKLPEAYEKWRQAGQCYERALQIKPDFDEAAYNWIGNLLLMHQAVKAENPDMAIPSLQQAKQIAHDFLAKYPQYAPKLAYNCACVFALENNPLQAIEQLKLAQQADDFPDKAYILQDGYLENIRESSEFQAWLKEAFPDTE